MLERQSLFGVCIIQDDLFQYVNKKFCEMFSYAEDAVTGKLHFRDIISYSDRAEVLKNHSNLLHGGIEQLQFGFTAVDSGHREIEVEVWCGRMQYQDRTAIQGVIMDVTERKNLYIREKSFEFKMMNEQKLSSIGQLATGIAHNLNTPISVILSNAELLQIKNAGSPELEKIIRQVERMGEIINGLLIKSKQEQIQTPQPINLNDILKNELEFLNANLEYKHNIEKEFKFGAKIPEIVAIYSDFSQSLMNILQNAIDAMYDRPVKKIKVWTEYIDNQIIIGIQDTGVGIAPDARMKLFDPFYSTKPSPMERKGDEPTGTGLGLSTVYNLLTPYGVRIEIDSEVGTGSTFRLIVPVTPNQNHIKIT
jgi:PAS domain S-box-containing protein